MPDLILPTEELRLDTRRKNPIENYLDRSPPVDGVWIHCQALKAQYPAPVQHRSTNPTFIYNCHGLTFASRRTQIASPNELRKILIEDDYSMVALRDLQAGDIAIYIDNRNEIFHSGIVMRVQKDGLLTVPWILSKWGGAHEIIHPIGECEYAKKSRAIEYYRIIQ